jgi:hypothetical protein
VIRLGRCPYCACGGRLHFARSRARKALRVLVSASSTPFGGQGARAAFSRVASAVPRLAPALLQRRQRWRTLPFSVPW